MQFRRSPMARRHTQPNVFNVDERYAALSEAGNRPGAACAAGKTGFEPFRYQLEEAMKRPDGSMDSRLFYGL